MSRLTKHVRDEDAMELRVLKQSRQIGPVIYVIKSKRLILRMTPETRRLMPAAFVLCQKSLPPFGWV